MKNLILFSILLSTTILASSQDHATIKFDLTNGQPTTSDKLTNLKLPITLEFTRAFNGKSIELITSGNPPVSIALQGLKFGGNELKLTGAAIFQINIDADGTVVEDPNANKVITDRFKIKIGTANPIEITLDQSATEIVRANPGNEDYEPGYIYYDAIKLTSEKDPEQIKEILKAYGVTSDNISQNPYLKDFFSDQVRINLVEGGKVSSLLSNLGNTDVTVAMAGVARFLAERTKEELNEVFFTKMKEQLNAYPELKTVFPKTSSFLNVIETYSYASIIQVLKESFETDIHNLPDNLYSIKDLTSTDCDKAAICGKNKNDCTNYTDCQTRLANLRKFFETQHGRWIGLGMFTVKEAIESSNPADLLKSISASSELTGIKDFSETNSKYADYNVASSIELADFISQSLISRDDNQVWITSKELNVLFKDKDKKAFRIYLGLLLAKEQKGDVKIDFYLKNNTRKTFGNVLIQAHDSTAKYEPLITGLIKNVHTAFNSVSNAVKKITAANSNAADIDPQALYDYYQAFTASLKSITHQTLFSTLSGNTNLQAKYDTVEMYLNPAVDIAYHISTKKYSAAVYDAVVMLNQVKSPAFEKPVLKSFIKYGTLISTVASAESSDEVKQALEASVLPIGSYSIKRKTNWSLSLNSYVGAYWSYANKKDYPPLGLSAPIGFNISKGFSATGKGGSISLNLQALDLGALVNYYLVKGDTASLPNDFSVKLSNVFAPGFNLCYNVPKTPLTVAWGGQYIPTLYTSDQINSPGELVPTNAWRWQAMILIDIPLFNIKVWDFNK